MAHVDHRPKFLDYPLLALRIVAIGAVAVHLFLGFFVSVLSPWIFFSTAALIALLVLREMYDDMARRFFELKSDTLEDHLDDPPPLVIDSRDAEGDDPAAFRDEIDDLLAVPPPHPARRTGD